METRQARQERQLVTYNQQNVAQGFGKAPLYFVSSSSVLPTTKVVFYFRVLAEASVTFVNSYGGTNATAKTLAVGEEFWGNFTTLTVASGEVVAYTL